MYPEGTPDTRDRDQFLDEVWLVDLEFGELVTDQEEVRKRFCRFTQFKFLLVLVDMVDPILAKEALPTMDLRIDRGQGPHRLGTIQVGDGPKQVRQILEEVGHSPTLVVDEKESHIVGVEVDSKAQDIRLNGFRLTRTGCPCDQTVGAMSFFMEIEIDQIVLPAQTDRHGQTLVRGMALPTTQDLKVIESFRLVHFKEGHRVWN